MGRTGCDGVFDFLDGSCRPACDGCSDDCDREDDGGEDEDEDDEGEGEGEGEGGNSGGDSGFTRASATPSLAVSPTSARLGRSPADPGA
ncbi:hypothetical protein [Streptomyces sp. FXY-T5]|uniref:hypothetical protein n=1 Tax=Streptomyces sp. FXY-T5 TaxID=3064901 RepID=UPI0027D2AAE8|nr:hypothetical protein [Streptomyces sp. FXY-T5]WMD03680.1 hypothetical protein Q7C01_04430 [Streptomyces sp. FXY-T5]